MQREVHFGQGSEQHQQAQPSALSPADQARLSRLSLFEPDDIHFTSRTLSKLLDQKQLAATQQQFVRQRQLKLLGNNLVTVLKTVATILFSIFITMLVIYLRLKPHAPNFAVTAAGFVSVSITPLTPTEIQTQQATGTGNYFAAYFTFNSSYNIFFQNDNEHVDLYVNKLELIVFYNGFRLGETMTQPFVQPRSTSQSFTVFVVQNMFPVPLNVYYTITKSGTMPIFFGADLIMLGRMSTVPGWKSPPFQFRVRCTLVLQKYIIIEKLCYRRNMG